MSDSYTSLGNTIGYMGSYPVGSLAVSCAIALLEVLFPTRLQSLMPAHTKCSTYHFPIIHKKS